MIYEYLCEKCSRAIDVVKPVSEFEKQERCPTCEEPMIRQFAPKKIHLYNTSVQERVFNPAFGKPMTWDEAKREAKAKNLIEVGNEKPQDHIKPVETNWDDI